jgi:hypothetical protein
VFNFVFDRRCDARPYPNLAPMQDNPHESYHGLGDEWPFIAPCRILLYCRDHNYPMSISYIDEPIPEHAFYPVGLAWFDYSQDYFAMMSNRVHELLKQQRLTVLFYYHEGDNPFYEKTRLDQLCQNHNLPTDCYQFVSGNTQANNIPGFVYFPDHELFYWRNSVKWNGRSMPGCSYHTRPRSRRYTALNRFHKWWRSTVMAQLHRDNILEKSYWSYNNIDMGDLPHDNPIEIDRVPGLRDYMNQFLSGSPYCCDHLTEQEHNSHWIMVAEHYDDSYCNLVLETLYDAEQSQGTFLTEKTFKPIRHAQPFVIFGTPNSVATLKELGYRTFDHAIDNSYDLEFHNTDRFLKTLETVKKINQVDMHAWYQSCHDDIVYNQQLFLSSKYNRLNTLEQQLLK